MFNNLLASTDEIAGITFYADGAPLIGASGQTNSGGAWQFNWDTTMMPNGTYDISAEVDFDSDDPVTNFPVTVTVNNVISFPNYFSRIFGSQMWIYAQTIPDAPYQIEMYDENTNDLGYFSGDADDNGYISFIWDLTDGNGNTFASTNFTGVFTVFTNTTETPQNLQTTGTNAPAFHPAGGVRPLDSGSSAGANQTWAQESGWANFDSFCIAFSPLVKDEGSQTTDAINDMVAEGVVNTLYDVYTINGENKPLGDTAFGVFGANDRSTLMGHLSDLTYRNFYFFGHGGPYGFGGASPDTVVTYSMLQQSLDNFLTTSKPANYHPYRLVFIDGCAAGKGPFSEVFGIPAQTVDDQFFVDAGVRSRAFLGFTKDVSFNFNQWQFESGMLAKFWTDWVINGLDLQTCVNNAENFGTGAMDKSAIIYGSANLRKGSQ